MFSLVKFPIIIVGALCLLTQINIFIKIIKKKTYFRVISAIIVLCILLLLSAYFNARPVIGSNPARNTVRLVLFLAELFLLAIWAVETDRSKYVMEFMFRYVLILVLITDILLFSRLLVFYSGRHEIYITGTKFDVSYMHMNLLTLWFIRNNMRFHKEGKSKRFVFFATILIIAISIRVDCMTGVLGCMSLFIFFTLLNTKIQKQFMRFSHPAFFLLFLILSVIFPFVSEAIVSTPFASFVVEEILGRDSTLTGRLAVFKHFSEKMAGHALWGFGYGNGNTAARLLFRVANAQNALLQWVLQSGLICTVVLCVLMLEVFRQLCHSTKQREIMPLVMLIYVYVLLGTVEITFNMAFLVWIALIFMNVNTKTDRLKQANLVAGNQQSGKT